MESFIPVLRLKVLDAPALGRTATIVRNGRDVTDGADVESRCSQGADRRLTAGARTTYPHINRPQTMGPRLVGGVHRGLLGGKGSALARSTKAERTRTLPGKRLALAVGDSHDGVVEGGLNVYQSIRNVLAVALFELLVLGSLAGCLLLLLLLCH